jgi:hypothetical protein
METRFDGQSVGYYYYYYPSGCALPAD